MKHQTKHKDPFAKREAMKYSQPIPSREYILEMMTSFDKTLSFNQIADGLALQSEFEYEALRRRLKAMVRDGQLVKGRGKKFQILGENETLKGRVVGSRDGHGFVRPEDGTSKIFLSAREMRQVFDGDLVEIQIVGHNKANRREAKIINVIERKNEEIVGRYYLENSVGSVEPDNQRINQDLIIPPKYRGKAKPGQIVVAKIITHPTLHTPAIGKISEVLGDYMAPGMEIDIAIRSHNIPHKWSAPVLKEVKSIPKKLDKKEIDKRKNLCELPFVTIDGEDARDFDDAVFCQPLRQGGWKLYVAIADVSYYVKPNSALDQEAYNRGNSVYFPQAVIPMLPEDLSNEMCSLKPHVKRFTLVCEMDVNKDGKIKSDFHFYRAVIESKARLTYTEVAALLTGSSNEKEFSHDKNVIPFLYHLRDLYHILHHDREKRGALDFDSQEVKVLFGQQRKIDSIIPVERTIAHRLIEECMLCANICAAKFLKKHKMPALYRVHDGPVPDKFEDLKVFLKELGLTISGGELPNPSDYANMLKKIKGRSDERLLQMALLRSLSQAVYSPDCDGHFGLNYDEYTHFTSPIRRYPDLVVHRSILAVLKKEPMTGLPNHNELKTVGEYTSMTERRADEAVREVISWLKCEYMMDKIGYDFDGIISSVTGFGLFVELKDLYVEGLVHISSLEEDYYIFDPIRHRLVGEHTKKIYRVGDPLRVQVMQINLADKKIEFEII